MVVRAVQWWQRVVGPRQVRPAAVERLKDGFRERLERRRRQYAPRLQQAEQALALHRLGALEGVFQDRRQWVYVGERGLIVEAHGLPQVIRWTDVTGVVRLVAEHYHPGISEDSTYALPAGHELTLRDSSKVILSSGYLNVLDPYPSIGRLVATLMPSAAGATVPKLPKLGELIEARLPAVSR